MADEDAALHAGWEQAGDDMRAGVPAHDRAAAMPPTWTEGHRARREAEDAAWGGLPPSASYAEWLTEGRPDGTGDPL